MYGLLLEKPESLRMLEVQEPGQPRENEVRIRIGLGGICGSDLRVYKGKISYAAYPIRPGHEAIGRVIGAGRGSRHTVGTKVVIFPNTYCGRCEFCLAGKTNICQEKKPMGVSIDGVFAQEIIVEDKYAVRVPEEIDDRRAILIEPFAVTVHALKKAEISPGKTIAIIGCGTEGLLAVALAKRLGADVTVADINPQKLEIAKRLGDVRTSHPKELTGETFDVVIEAAGVIDAIEQAIQLVKPGGTMVALGITADPAMFSPIHIVRSEISIHGSIVYTPADFIEAMEWLKDPGFKIEPVISRFLPLEKCQEAFNLALSGNHAKIVLQF